MSNEFLEKIDQAQYLKHKSWMELAITLAAEAGSSGEIPVGAVIVDNNNNLIAQAYNRKESDRDPTAHAEILAIRAAAKKLDSWHLNDCTLYVTLEPCPMCAGAIIHSRLKLLVYALDDPKTGSIRSVLNLPDSACSNHDLNVLGGILEQTAKIQLQSWFKKLRQKKTVN